MSVHKEQKTNHGIKIYRFLKYVFIDINPFSHVNLFSRDFPIAFSSLFVFYGPRCLILIWHSAEIKNNNNNNK